MSVIIVLKYETVASLQGYKHQNVSYKPPANQINALYDNLASMNCLEMPRTVLK